MDLFGQTERARAIDALHAATALYTVEPVVEALLDRIAWPAGSRRLCDPSCGDGMFLECALRRLLSSEPDIGRERLLGLLEGWEVHPHAAHQARARVARVLVTFGWSPPAAAEASGQLVRNRDFLTEGPSDRRVYDVIAGNPPYLRAANVPPLLRSEYDAVIPPYARSDLMHGFLDRCSRVLAEDGELCMVTADRWLFNSGAAALRAAMGASWGIDHLERLDPETAFYRPKQRVKGAPPRIHPVAVVLRRPSDCSVARLSSAAVYPDAPAEAGPAGRTLGDVAQVRLAPWLGAFGIFVVDRETARQLPPECLVPAVDTDDIVDGRLRPATRYAIRTVADREPPPEVLAHLRANMHRMAARGRRRCEWLPPETWAHHDLSRPSLLVPRISQTLRTVRVPPGTLAMNHNLTVVSAAEASLDEIEAILASQRAQAWVDARAPRLEHEYLSITTSFLRQLPIE